MTHYELNLFNALNKLSEENDAFYSSEQELTIKGIVYTVRSYSYRLASYTMFDAPYARESRGTAFYTEKGKDNWKLFCRAFPKFWNLGEGIDSKEFMQDNKIQNTFEKLDGSIILFGDIEDKILAKSKTSINSEQAEIAQRIIDNSSTWRNYISGNLKNGYTTVCELVGSCNVIVIRYNCTAELRVLGLVNNQTGEVHVPKTFPKNIKYAKNYNKTWEELLYEQENSQENIEGYVLYTDKGMIKLKLKKYVQLHHLKDSVNNTKALTELIIDDNIDDLMVSFEDDEDTIKYITKEQERISKLYNTLVQSVTNIYSENKHLERKDYAIKLKSNGLFGLLMNMYLGRNVDFKGFFMKNKLYET